MKHYQLTSTAFEGFVDIYFNELGLLTEFSTKEAQLSEMQQIWLLKQMPREQSELENVIKGSGTAVLTEIKQEISFDAFWNKYDDKELSSKKRTFKKWEKMNKTEQLKAFNYITRYFSNIPPGTRKKMAETYLNNELWNN